MSRNFVPAMFMPDPHDGTPQPRHIPDARIRVRIVMMPESGCWIWTGSLNDNGYGHFTRHVGGRQVKIYVHRYTYMVFHGDIPKDHEVHHTCWNRSCCAPAHLEAVTHRMNQNK